MTDAFATRFMHFALQVTNTERGMAVNPDMNVIAVEKLSEQELNSPDFTGFQNIAKAYEAQEAPHITNNLILDPKMAPNTNTNFANLRIVIIFPLHEQGAVYIDQHVRKGVVPQDTVEKLMQVAQQIIASGNLDVTLDELQAMYATV